MPLGASKYDDLATLVRKRAKARGVIVMVFGGEVGSGFSVQTQDAQLIAILPELLRDMAADIEADMLRQEGREGER